MGVKEKMAKIASGEKQMSNVDDVSSEEQQAIAKLVCYHNALKKVIVHSLFLIRGNILNRCLFHIYLSVSYDTSIFIHILQLFYASTVVRLNTQIWGLLRW